MGALAIVEVHPPFDDALGCKAVGDILQVDSLVFERAPQAFDEPQAGEANMLSKYRPRPSIEIRTRALVSVVKRLEAWNINNKTALI